MIDFRARNFLAGSASHDDDAASPDQFGTHLPHFVDEMSRDLPGLIVVIEQRAAGIRYGVGVDKVEMISAHRPSPEGRPRPTSVRMPRPPPEVQPTLRAA